jgi:adenine-specific DNA-methyltransferase
MSQPENFEATSANITDEQKAKLKSLFPEIVTEGGKIDFDRLKLTLGETVDAGKERYGMNWPGKADCFKTIQRPSMATLVPARDESVSFDTTENLIIEGDNLETLKLLQKAYLGKVKMIYIDPPYNTGGDFIYPDDFSESLETYLRYTGQTDAEGRKFSTNVETDGRFHSKWMNMMYPRLFLARNLLRDDGAIYISIDEGEFPNLRKICDEIFGEENFVTTFVWEKRTNRENRKVVSSRYDNVVCYCKDLSQLSKAVKQLPMSEKALANYKNPDNDPRGLWKSDPATAQAGHGTKSQFYTFTAPNGTVHELESGRCWLYTKPVMETAAREGRLWFGREGNGVPRIKTYLDAKERGLTPETIWFADDVGTNEIAKNALKELFNDKSVFDSPKPVDLIKQAILLTAEDGIILDFFAGAGTTGHAVFAQNASDNGSRKFILVQLPELCSDDSEAKLAGLRTVADITKERLLLAGKEIQNEWQIRKANAANEPDLLDPKKIINNPHSPDFGFRVFKLQSSNFKAWNTEQPKDDAELVKQLTLHVDHLVAGRTQEDVLYELLLKSGFPLNTKVEKTSLAGKDVFSIAEGAMLICLEKELTPEVIKAMAEKKPERVVCLDAGFADNDQLKTNAVQTMKSKGVTKFQTV